MAALAQDAYCSLLGTPVYAPFTVNVADIYFQGAIVYVDTGGGSQVVPAAGDRAVGIATKQQNLATTDTVEVLIGGYVWMPVGTAITAADEGERLILDISATQSDNPADLVSAGDTTLAANDATIGRILRVTATQMLVAIGPDTGQLFVSIATTPASGYWD